MAKVSVIIPVKDATDKYLKECIESIDNQTFNDTEVIVCSGGSILDARKQGISRAQGEFIIMVDSDQTLSRDVIARCVYALENGADGVTWFERARNPQTWLEKVIAYDKELFHSAQDDDPVYGSAIPRAFKVEFLRRIKWDELPPVTFEHSILHKQIVDMGAKIVFIDAVVWHREPRTVKELWRKFHRYGYYYIQALRVERRLVLNHSKPRRVYFTRKALKHPVLYIGLWVHWGIKALAAGLGALSYLKCEFVYNCAGRKHE
jgi:cellulose synthase/poly-beta-1,6-N-acetylglucosamine synthase-like glycosyltransferase